MTSESGIKDGTGLIEHDPWLEPHREALKARYRHYRALLARFDDHGGLLGPISRGHRRFGLNRGEHEGRKGIWYREWAPSAHSLALIGDFNQWDRQAHRMQRNEWGTWHLFLPDGNDGRPAIEHGGHIKVHVESDIGPMDRIPAYIRRAVQVDEQGTYVGVHWDPPEPYAWKHPSPGAEPRGPGTEGMRIYEAHVGMAVEDGRVGTYNDFTEQVLPWAADLGYNAIQLMAIMEHPYYGSFGYHVSNFFAASSRFGTPEDLKRLIDTAHGLGLRVIMDLIHSHAVKNLYEGLNQFDGTDYHYFHGGARGRHDAWDSLCFDYTRYEVLRFLLSNCRYWLEEYRFDGFRFDGVTSMMYLDHGLGKQFSSYDDYFGGNVDMDAVAYLTVANELIHTVRPNAITVAEDVSGMVGLARPVEEGGLGFDYRLAMGVPDYWIKLLKEKPDEGWNLHEMYHTLMNRRYGERHIGYAESHDQALVGDKTIAFWLMDAEQYTSMSVLTPSLIVDRGIALHKMIRLITYCLGGEGWLNFMGNEFGHPEWVDFPRVGNDYSYHYARRQWSLAKRDDLRYKGLLNFDRAMHQLDINYHLLEDPFIQSLAIHDDTRQMVFRRGPLVMAFNFHATESYTDLRIPVPDAEDYTVILSTDAKAFEGFDRVDAGTRYPLQKTPMYGCGQSIQIYLPSRSAQVLAPNSRIKD
ncbi:MAG: alpha amylase C-terminal domain-containing protein [Phycisphaeraceae bacterium]|nr:alpha amylase C-terminal domain-containing protein [Phycisphaeraceae bacterium]